MRTIVKGKNVEVPDHVRAYAERKLGHIARLVDDRTDAIVELSNEPAGEKLEGIAKILLRTWRNDPALVTVMVREVARSHQLQDRVDEVREAFAIVQRIVEEGQVAGVFRRDVDARLASWLFYGGLEEVLTGWVLGQLPDSEDDVASAERTAVDVALRGLSA